MAKKTVCLFLLLSVILCLSACSSKNLYAIDKNKIVTFFSSNISVSYDEQLYSCSYKNTAEGQSELSIVSPTEIEGLTFKRTANGYTVSQNDISISSDEFFNNDSCFVKILNDILYLIPNDPYLIAVDSNSEKTVFKGNLKDKDYYVSVFNNSGVISNISINELKLNFDFL